MPVNTNCVDHFCEALLEVDQSINGRSGSGAIHFEQLFCQLWRYRLDGATAAFYGLETTHTRGH